MTVPRRHILRQGAVLAALGRTAVAAYRQTRGETPTSSLELPTAPGGAP